ncbi:SDR family oxidoreductase [Mesorhizobium sp. M0013]|uniref:SDR family oxidoreductase n=1 Tax=Mesorhizobium sp. M0013 TaxID=2956841 RepID=UPI00333D61E4
MATGLFAEKVCLVTGSTQGVGQATAMMMAEEGASGLVICGRQRDAGESVRAALEQLGTSAIFVEADLARVEDCFAVVDATEARFGRVDVVANVAGLTDRGTIEDTDVATYDRLFAVNTRAPFFIIQRSVPLMRRAGSGAIVNVISIAAHGGAPFISAYVASKAALVGLTKNVAHALRRDRIRVNGLNMGWTATPGEERIQRTAHARGDNWLEEISRDQPFGRLLEPREIARAICFLASSESAIVTGSVMDFDQTVIGAYD